MVDSQNKNPTERGKPIDTTLTDDDATVFSGKKAKNHDYIEDEMQESYLRYEIPYRKGKGASPDDVQLHAELLDLLTQVYDNDELRLFDNRNERARSLSAKKWRDRKYYNSKFNSHVDIAQRKTVVSHRILSKKPLTSLKGDPSIIAFLKKSNTFLRAHLWKEDELELKDIGFLLSYVPSKHSKTFVTNDMCERCDSSLSDIEWSNAPPFQLIHAQPKIKLPGKQKLLRTHAYSVQVKMQDASAMNFFFELSTTKNHCICPTA